MAKKKSSKKTATPESAKPRGLKRDKTIWPQWDVEISGGKVIFKDRQAFDEHLIPLEGKEHLVCVIRRKVNPRSRHVEKYYHAVPVRMIAAEMQITDQEAHEMLKGMFLRTEERIERPDGKVIRYARTMSTTELGDKRYYEYVFNEVIPWAAQPTGDDGLGPDSGLGLYIPLPNEADWDDQEYYEQFINSK